MPISIKYVLEHKLILEYAVGTITMEDLELYQVKMRKDEKFKKVSRVLTFLKDSDIQFSSENIEEFIAMVRVTDKELQRKWAIVVSSVHETVLGMLVADDPFFKNNTCVCSTFKRAASFLGISVDCIDMNTENYTLVIGS
jgi:hypothetical protein